MIPETKTPTNYESFLDGFQQGVNWCKKYGIHQSPNNSTEQVADYDGVYFKTKQGARLYSKQEVDDIRRETWNWCRCFVDGCAPFEAIQPYFKYKTFEDYLQSINDKLKTK